MFAQALILTADLSWFGNREADLRTGFTVPPDYSWRQCAGAAAAPAWTWDWLTHPPYSYALVDQVKGAGSARRVGVGGEDGTPSTWSLYGGGECVNLLSF